MPSSPLIAVPLTPEDASLFQAVRHIAFKNDINKVLYAREPSAKTLDKVVQDTIKEIHNNPEVSYMVVKDKSTGEVCAGSKWRFLGPKDESGSNGKIGERTWEQVNEYLSIPPPYEESDVEIWNNAFKLFQDTQREVMQLKPYYTLHTLVTHPDHQRRGAGSMLLKQLCDLADAKGVETYLDASQMGLPLYERFGFKRVKEVVVSARTREKFVLTVMVRPPVVKKD